MLISSPQDSYYVVTDTVGSPILFFSPDGSLSKEISRSPYGHVTYDSNPSIRVPIGLFGGIEVSSDINFCEVCTSLNHYSKPSFASVTKICC